MSNIALNPGTGGATLGTDTVGGVDYQKIKVTYGTDGSAPTSVDGSNGLPVNVLGTLSVSSIANPVAVTGTFWQATQPVSGTFWQTTQPVSGTFWQATQPVSGTFWQSVQPVSIQPATTGGWSKWSTPKNNSNAGLTALAQIKGSAGALGGYYLFNSNTSAAYVQVFDALSGSVTLGTTRPDMVMGIPAGGGANLAIPSGVSFTTGITVAATTTASGSTAPTNGLDCTFLYV